MGTNRPMKEFRCQNIRAVIWNNEKKVENGVISFKTVSLSRSYKKKDEDIWRSDVINNLRRNDLQKVTLVMQKVQEALLLDEQERDEEHEE